MSTIAEYKATLSAEEIQTAIEKAEAYIAEATESGARQEHIDEAQQNLDEFKAA